MKASDLPDFKSLPPVEGMPHGCAWGLFDKNGERDQLGCLNLLTPDTILAAKNEIKAGISVSVNWPIHKLHIPIFGRRAANHTIIATGPSIANDDELHINTQSGSQWDGLKHFAHQPSQKFYNNLSHSEIPTTTDNGIHHWHAAPLGGLAGRGVLLDYPRYAALQGIPYDVMTRHAISVDVLDAIAREQGVELKSADFLLVRTGFTAWYEDATEAERVVKLGTDEGEDAVVQWAGVEGSERTMEWLWNHHFAAVAGDSISWEQWPMDAEWKVHEFALALWGMPIGECWDLERLAQVCEEQGRWSFFLTSAPLNVVGGVASPPNAICIL